MECVFATRLHQARKHKARANRPGRQLDRNDGLNLCIGVGTE